jgi:hypothetical protein
LKNFVSASISCSLREVMLTVATGCWSASRGASSHHIQQVPNRQQAYGQRSYQNKPIEHGRTSQKAPQRRSARAPGSSAASGLYVLPRLPYRLVTAVHVPYRPRAYPGSARSHPTAMGVAMNATRVCQRRSRDPKAVAAETGLRG